LNAILIKNALDCAIKSAAEKAIRGQLSRSRKLSVADTIRLLIGAEGGSLDRILRAAGIEVTASAVSQRRAWVDPAVFCAVFDSFNAACADTETFHGYHFSRGRNNSQSPPAILRLRPLSATAGFQTG
jgi:hypothetical protein